MGLDKKICKLTDPDKQQAESDSYWRNLPIGERLSAVWEVSEAAYSFRAAFKRNLTNDAERPQRAITRIQRARS
ncbi:MAG TPA: hypothetical protein VJS37_10660 [Terriglobales bacterium]|nr:hypothetical protein [Terriglobales bacterium]